MTAEEIRELSMGPVNSQSVLPPLVCAAMLRRALCQRSGCSPRVVRGTVAAVALAMGWLHAARTACPQVTRFEYNNGQTHKIAI